MAVASHCSAAAKSARKTFDRLRAPDEDGAQERAWAVVRSAYRERPPQRMRRFRVRLTLLPVLAVVAGGIALSPAGATITHWVKDTLGVPHAARALFLLEELIVEHFVQHNAQVNDGLAAVQAFFAAAGPVDVEVHRTIADGDLVAVHSHFKTWNTAVVDIFRLNDEGKIVEHWDVLQPIPDTTASGNDMFSQLT